MILLHYQTLDTFCVSREVQNSFEKSNIQYHSDEKQSWGHSQNMSLMMTI
jgi:hypothetical protein